MLSRLSLRSKPPVNKALPVAASNSAVSKASGACVPPLSEMWSLCKVKPSTFCLAFKRKACAMRVWLSETSCSHTPPFSNTALPLCRHISGAMTSVRGAKTARGETACQSGCLILSCFNGVFIWCVSPWKALSSRRWKPSAAASCTVGKRRTPCGSLSFIMLCIMRLSFKPSI